MSRLTPIDEAAPRLPLLVRPFQAGMIGWIVVFGATVVVLAGGAITSQMSLAASVPVLVIPVVLAFGFGMVQWWQVRSAGADPTSWWHLGAIPVAVLIWYLWPNVPSALSEADGGRRSRPRSRAACWPAASSSSWSATTRWSSRPAANR